MLHFARLITSVHNTYVNYECVVNCICSHGVGTSASASQPTSRRNVLRANAKQALMKQQQMEQEKLRRRVKPFTVSVPYTRQSATLNASQFTECRVKVCILCMCTFLCVLSMLFCELSVIVIVVK